ncbi:hypothetical protein EDM76_08500 [bacterium]|nr:MAG: hypothetical protein EDM76_08500 [bacterium]
MFSTRLPEEAIHELDDASRRLGITRKQVLAEAIMLRATDTSRERPARSWQGPQAHGTPGSTRGNGHASEGIVSCGMAPPRRDHLPTVALRTYFDADVVI